MPAKIYKRLATTATEELYVLLEFFDHDDMRQYYTGLIADIREELARRGASEKRPTS